MLRYLLPLGIFVVLVVFLGAGLTRDPSLIPSPLIGKPAPEFHLSSVKALERTVTLADIKGKVALLNVWATWCVACRAEHPVLVDIARASSVPIYGLDYKDDRAEAINWLSTLGDPYVLSIFDPEGTFALDLGVYGVPETFVLDAEGVIAHKQIGPITREIWESQLAPLVERLRDEG